MAMRMWRPGHSARIQSSKQCANVWGSTRFTSARSQRAQPALAGDSVVIGREFSQKVELVIAPGGDFVEIVTRGDSGAGQQQQDLGQRVDHPPRLALIIEPRKMLQQQSYASLGQVLVGQ